MSPETTESLDRVDQRVEQLPVGRTAPKIADGALDGGELQARVESALGGVTRESTGKTPTPHGVSYLLPDYPDEGPANFDQRLERLRKLKVKDPLTYQERIRAIILYFIARKSGDRDYRSHILSFEKDYPSWTEKDLAKLLAGLSESETLRKYIP